jgi:SpoVK/Ycf46/Vps4 family AAA+-type ATPase
MGRYSILQVLSKKLTVESTLRFDSNVDFRDIARMTDGLSGSDLTSVVKSAKSMAEKSLIDQDSLARSLDEVVITQQHFIQSVASSGLIPNVAEKVIFYSEQFSRFTYTIENLITRFWNNSSSVDSVLSILLVGPNGCGLSTLSRYFVSKLMTVNVQIIQPASENSEWEQQNLPEKIGKCFEQANKYERSVVVLDGIDKMLNYHEWAHYKYNIGVARNIMSLLQFRPRQRDSRLIVIGTAHNVQPLDTAGITESFRFEKQVPLIETLSSVQKGTHFLIRSTILTQSME